VDLSVLLPRVELFDVNRSDIVVTMLMLLGWRPVSEEPVCKVDGRRHSRLDTTRSHAVPQRILHVLTDSRTAEQRWLLQGTIS